MFASAAEFLKDRGFQYGIALSLAWHLFWLFGLSVDLNGKKQAETIPKIYFLGPVLTDDPFNTIVSTKPELSTTFYRAEEEIAETLEPQIQNLGHQSAGDLVSLPGARIARNLLRGVLADDSGREGILSEKLAVEIIESPFPITGPLAKRGLFYIPELPPALASANPADGAAFDITADAQGRVIKTEMQISTGDAQADAAWQRYLKTWQFMPLESTAGTADQKGQVRILPARDKAHP